MKELTCSSLSDVLEDTDTTAPLHEPSWLGACAQSVAAQAEALLTMLLIALVLAVPADFQVHRCLCLCTPRSSSFPVVLLVTYAKSPISMFIPPRFFPSPCCLFLRR